MSVIFICTHSTAFHKSIAAELTQKTTSVYLPMMSLQEENLVNYRNTMVQEPIVSTVNFGFVKPR